MRATRRSSRAAGRRRSPAIWCNPDLLHVFLLRTADETALGSKTGYEFLVLPCEREYLGAQLRHLLCLGYSAELGRQFLIMLRALTGRPRTNIGLCAHFFREGTIPPLKQAVESRLSCRRGPIVPRQSFSSG